MPGRDQAARNEQAVEVAVFLFLIAPSMVLSLFVVRRVNLNLVFAAVATIFRDLGLVSLILFFLRRNGENVERIGWSFRRAGREAALGAALLERGLLSLGLFIQSEETGLEHFFIGRNIDRIMDHANCAALIVRIHLAQEDKNREAVVRDGSSENVAGLKRKFLISCKGRRAHRPFCRSCCSTSAPLCASSRAA